MPDAMTDKPDWSSSARMSLDAFESNPVSWGSDSPEVYGLVRGLQRQLHLQKTELDTARSRISETEMKLRQVSADLMTAQEVERRRIALDLHDGVGQSLNALNFGVCSALSMVKNGDNVASAEMLTQLSHQVKNTLEDVRRIAHNLRPAMLDDIGIVGTLSWFFRDFCRIYTNFEVYTEINVRESDVPVTLRTPIFRIVQEALSNVVKHSKATEILVALSSNAEHIELEIADNGCGFDFDNEMMNIAATNAGLGLMGMQDRVEFSGGDFLLNRLPGKGTQIKCCWNKNPAVEDWD